MLEERDETGELEARYEHGQELGPLRQDAKSESGIGGYLTSYYLGDGQDSTRQLTDTTGAITNTYFYDAFGVELQGGQVSALPVSTAFRYTGQQQDASGLYYLRARYYNAGNGRFLNHDPVLGSSDDPITMHRYLYAGADPANAVDPSGREFTVGGMCQSIAIGTAISGLYGAGTTVAKSNFQDLALGDIAEGAADGVVGFISLPYTLVTQPGATITGLVQWHIDMINVIRDPSKTPLQKATAGVMLAGSVLAASKAVKNAPKISAGAKLAFLRIYRAKIIQRFLYEEEGSVQVSRSTVQTEPTLRPGTSDAIFQTQDEALQALGQRLGAKTRVEIVSEYPVDGGRRGMELPPISGELKKDGFGF